jgi:hypothetical protein
MAAPRQGLPVRLERAPHRGAAFALSNASKRARIRSIGSRPSSARIDAARAHVADRRRTLIGEAEKLRSREPVSTEGYRTKKKREAKKA